jgi:hypothetical protein
VKFALTACALAAIAVFDGQQHRIGGRRLERDATAIEWFRRFGAS